MVSNWSYIPETSNLSQNRRFFVPLALKFDRWPRKIIGYLFYATSSFVHHFTTIGDFKLELQSGNAQFGSKSAMFFSRVTLKFDGWPWKKNRTTFLCYFKLCASFNSHQWIQARVTVRKRPIWIKMGDFFVPCDLEIRWMTLKNNRAPFLHHFKLCASFRSHL